jgi:hypothetical protein
LHFREDHVCDVVCDGDIAFVGEGGVRVGVGGISSWPV